MLESYTAVKLAKCQVEFQCNKESFAYKPFNTSVLTLGDLCWKYES